MLKDSKLAFIGSGVMAEAFLQGLLRQELVSADHTWCSDPVSARLKDLQARFGVHITTDNAAAVDAADVVVLSVKPQTLAEAMAVLRGHMKPHHLVISIVAGATMASISQGLQHSTIVRAMPNTPARIGEGITAWTVTDAVSNTDRERARSIFQALGEEIFMDHEEYLDMATAVSGSGPAYVFLLMEALIDAGVHLGLSRRVAQQLVLKTMQGSVEFARQSGVHPAELRNAVTSPGGTSAEALYRLEKGGVRTVISRAVFAAYERSRALSQSASGTNGKTHATDKATEPA